MRALFLVFLLSLPGWGQVAGPDVAINGYVKTPSLTLTLVAGQQMLFVVSAGKTLGDYEVKVIQPEAVTFAYKQHSWPIKLRAPSGPDLLTATRAPEGPDDTADVILSGAPRPYALRLLAGAAGRNLYIFPSLSGKANASAQGTSLRGMMQAVAASASMEIAQNSDFAVAAPLKAQAGNWSIPGSGGLSGQVSLDFHKADLAYVLLVLARESHQSCVLGADLTGSVTIYTSKAQPIKDLLTLVCCGQEKPASVSVSGGFILASVSEPKLMEPESPGPAIDFETDMHRPGPTQAEEILQLVARKAKLKLVLPTGFRASAYVHLEHAPALAAAERLLAVNGYHCRVDKGQLLVSR
jgi:hypothetical protein